MTAYVHTLTVIVPANRRAAAQLIGKCVDPDFGGDLSFSIRLSATGEEPPTHYALHSPITAEKDNLTRVTATQLANWLNNQRGSRWPHLPAFDATDVQNFLADVTIRVDRSLDEVLSGQGLQRIVGADIET